MKRTLGLLALAALLYTPPAKAEDWTISTVPLWTNTRIATNAASVIDVELTSRRPLGYFSLQLGVGNTVGTVKALTYEVSNDGQYWVNGGTIASSIAAGTNFYGNSSLPIPLASWVRFRLVMTNDGANVTGYLTYQ